MMKFNPINIKDSNLHFIKLDEKYIDAVETGIKTFELRKNDRNYKVNDIIIFIDKNNKIIFNDAFYRITYILKDVPKYGLKRGFCILGIVKEKEDEK